MGKTTKATRTMRIIAGKAKGRSLKVPKDVSRPTTDRVRESVFGQLSEFLPEARVLDLFAGSGGLGLEALSRGANSCVFVDQHRGACRVIEQNLQKTDLKNGRVIAQDVISFLKSEQEPYDLIFADPPYADGLKDLAAELVALDAWRRWLSPEGYFIVERESTGEIPPADCLELVRKKDYGRSRILIYQLRE